MLVIIYAYLRVLCIWNSWAHLKLTGCKGSLSWNFILEIQDFLKFELGKCNKNNKLLLQEMQKRAEYRWHRLAYNSPEVPQRNQKIEQDKKILTDTIDSDLRNHY